MTLDLLIPRRDIILGLFPYVNGWVNILHFLYDRVPQVCVIVLCINFPSLFHGLRYSFSKFVCSEPVL